VSEAFEEDIERDKVTGAYNRPARGRPPKYRPQFCDEIIDLGKQGKSMAQMASYFDVSRGTIDVWAEAYPEFLEALKRAQAHAQDYWEQLGRDMLTADKFHSAVWTKIMQARFRQDYTEQTKTTIDYNGSVEVRHKVENTSPRQLARAVLSIIEKAAAENASKATEETIDVD
jgi:hypothetical protein